MSAKYETAHARAEQEVVDNLFSCSLEPKGHKVSQFVKINIGTIFDRRQKEGYMKMHFCINYSDKYYVKLN